MTSKSADTFPCDGANRQTDRPVMISNIFPLSKDQEQLSETGIRGRDT